MINVKQKGNRFERECAKTLQRLSLLKWNRVPQSGGIGTSNKGISNPVFLGDVFTEGKPWNTTVVECKHTKVKIDLFNFFNSKSILSKWLTQTITEAKGNPYMLMFKDGTHKMYAIVSPHNTLFKETEAIFFKFKGIDFKLLKVKKE